MSGSHHTRYTELGIKTLSYYQSLYYLWMEKAETPERNEGLRPFSVVSAREYAILKAMMNDRQYSRFSFKESVGYQIGEAPLTGSLSGDISEGGLRLNVHEFIPLNTIVRLQIHVSDPERVLAAQGRVVWVREVPQSDRYDVGIEFVVDQDTGPVLRSYVSSRRFQIE